MPSKSFLRGKPSCFTLPIFPSSQQQSHLVKGCGSLAASLALSKLCCFYTADSKTRIPLFTETQTATKLLISTLWLLGHMLDPLICICHITDSTYHSRSILYLSRTFLLEIFLAGRLIYFSVRRFSGKCECYRGSSMQTPESPIFVLAEKTPI